MKKPTNFQASSSILGSILLISLFGTLALTSLDALHGLYELLKNQWLNFTDGFSMMQPHRTVFP